MSEMVLDINAIPSYLTTIFQTKKVRVNQSNKIITIVPIEEPAKEEYFSCPFLGIAVDSELTVEKFMAWKREERAAEYEQELRA